MFNVVVVCYEMVQRIYLNYSECVSSCVPHQADVDATIAEDTSKEVADKHSSTLEEKCRHMQALLTRAHFHLKG